MKRFKGGWKSRLNKQDLKHLKDTAGVRTLQGFLRTHKHQEALRDTGNPEPCWDCLQIARKLKLTIRDRRKDNV